MVPVLRHLQRRQPRLEHQRLARRDRHLHVRQQQAGADHRGQGRPARRPAELLVHGRRRAHAEQLPARRRRRSRRCPTRAPSPTSCPGPATRSSETVPERLGPDQRDVRRRQPGVEHQRRARRDGHLHVHEPQARPDRGRQGRPARRPAGLQLHRRRRALAGQLPARRRRQPDAVEHPHLQRRRARLAATRSRRPCPAGWDQPSAIVQRRQPGRRTSTSSAGETVTCTFTNRKRGQIVAVQGRGPERSAGLLVHGRRRALARRASRSTTTPTGRSSNTRTFTNVLPGQRLLRSPRPCPAGWDQTARDLRRRQPGVEHQRGRRRDGHLHLHEPQARADRGASRTPCPTTRRTSRSRPAAACHPASFSLDDDADATLSNTRTFNDVPVGSGLLGRGDRARAAGTTTSATCDDGSPVSNIDVAAGETVTCTFTNRKRGPDRGRQGRHSRRPAGLLVHGRRRPLARQLQPRRRRRRDAVEHAHVRRRRRRAPATRSRETVPGGWDQTSRHLQRRQPGLEHRRRARRDRHLHVREPQARPASWSSRTRSPNDPQDFAFTAGGGLSPDELPARRRRRRDAVEHAHVRERRAGLRATRCPRPCRAAGTSRAPPVTTAARSRTSTWPPARRSPARSRTSKRGQIVVVKDAVPERPAGLRLHGRRRALARRSFQLDDDSNPTLSNTQHVHQRRGPAPATRSRRPSRPAGDSRAPPATTAARCRTSTSGRARRSPARS